MDEKLRKLKNKPQYSTCCNCGYSWVTGRDGSHSCAENMAITIAKLEKELAFEKSKN